MRSTRVTWNNRLRTGAYRPDLRVWSAALSLALASAAALAEPPTPAAVEFSADIVSYDAAGSTTGGGRVFVSNSGKVRIETPDAPTGFFLIDGAAATAVFVRPAQQIFMDARQSSRLTQIFLPVDPSGPCSQWQAAARNAGAPNTGGEWHCERSDAARVEGGATTVQYTVVSPDQKSTQRWIDTTLGFPVKLRMSDGKTLALEHIRVAAQPENLFSVPPGYRKSDPQALIDRIKQSDVWVEPPK
jgi:hypothetical protein